MAKMSYKFLLKKGIIRLIEPSLNMKKSYFEMSKKFFKSADLLLKNDFYESSTSDFYYSLYNSLLGILFFCGIKSENHNSSINLLKDLFEKKELFEIILEVKKERIDKQYYHQTLATKENLIRIKSLCQKFNLEINSLFEELNEEKVKNLQIKLRKLN